MLSSLCLGTTVTSSISQRKATSVGTRPEGSGRAMVDVLGARTMAGKLRRRTAAKVNLQRTRFRSATDKDAASSAFFGWRGCRGRVKTLTQIKNPLNRRDAQLNATKLALVFNNCQM